MSRARTAVSANRHSNEFFLDHMKQVKDCFEIGKFHRGLLILNDLLCHFRKYDDDNIFVNSKRISKKEFKMIVRKVSVCLLKDNSRPLSHLNDAIFKARCGDVSAAIEKYQYINKRFPTYKPGFVRHLALLKSSGYFHEHAHLEKMLQEKDWKKRQKKMDGNKKSRRILAETNLENIPHQRLPSLLSAEKNFSFFSSPSGRSPSIEVKRMDRLVFLFGFSEEVKKKVVFQDLDKYENRNGFEKMIAPPK